MNVPYEFALNRQMQRDIILFLEKSDSAVRLSELPRANDRHLIGNLDYLSWHGIVYLGFEYEQVIGPERERVGEHTWTGRGGELRQVSLTTLGQAWWSSTTEKSGDSSTDLERFLEHLQSVYQESSQEPKPGGI